MDDPLEAFSPSPSFADSFASGLNAFSDYASSSGMLLNSAFHRFIGNDEKADKLQEDYYVNQLVNSFHSEDTGYDQLITEDGLNITPSAIGGVLGQGLFTIGVLGIPSLAAGGLAAAFGGARALAGLAKVAGGTRGLAIGAGATAGGIQSFRLSAAEVAQELSQEGLLKGNEGKALGTASLVAALDMLSIGTIAKPLVAPAAAKKLKQSFMKRLGIQSAKVSATEMPTEALQETLMIANARLARGEDPWDFNQEEKIRVANGAASALVMAGVFGPATASYQHFRSVWDSNVPFSTKDGPPGSGKSPDEDDTLAPLVEEQGFVTASPDAAESTAEILKNFGVEDPAIVDAPDLNKSFVGDPQKAEAAAKDLTDTSITGDIKTGAAAAVNTPGSVSERMNAAKDAITGRRDRQREALEAEPNVVLPEEEARRLEMEDALFRAKESGVQTDYDDGPILDEAPSEQVSEQVPTRYGLLSKPDQGLANQSWATRRKNQLEKETGGLFEVRQDDDGKWWVYPTEPESAPIQVEDMDIGSYLSKKQPDEMAALDERMEAERDRQEDIDNLNKMRVAPTAKPAAYRNFGRGGTTGVSNFDGGDQSAIPYKTFESAEKQLPNFQKKYPNADLHVQEVPGGFVIQDRSRDFNDPDSELTNAEVNQSDESLIEKAEDRATIPHRAKYVIRIGNFKLDLPTIKRLGQRSLLRDKASVGGTNALEDMGHAILEGLGTFSVLRNIEIPKDFLDRNYAAHIDKYGTTIKDVFEAMGQRANKEVRRQQNALIVQRLQKVDGLPAHQIFNYGNGVQLNIPRLIEHGQFHNNFRSRTGMLPEGYIRDDFMTGLVAYERMTDSLVFEGPGFSGNPQASIGTTVPMTLEQATKRLGDIRERYDKEHWLADSNEWINVAELERDLSIADGNMLEEELRWRQEVDRVTGDVKDPSAEYDTVENPKYYRYGEHNDLGTDDSQVLQRLSKGDKAKLPNIENNTPKMFREVDNASTSYHGNGVSILNANRASFPIRKDWGNILSQFSKAVGLKNTVTVTNFEGFRALHEAGIISKDTYQRKVNQAPLGFAVPDLSGKGDALIVINEIRLPAHFPMSKSVLQRTVFHVLLHEFGHVLHYSIAHGLEQKGMNFPLRRDYERTLKEYGAARADYSFKEWFADQAALYLSNHFEEALKYNNRKRFKIPLPFRQLFSKIKSLWEKAQTIYKEYVSESPIDRYGAPVFPSVENLLDSIIADARIKTAINKRIPMNGFKMYSGGAVGADTVWGNIAKSFGMETIHFYGEGFKTPRGNTELSRTQLQEARQAVAQAAKRRGYNMPAGREDKQGNRRTESLILRNYFQVKGADSVFAIGEIDPDNRNVKGDTGWAVAMAMDMGKPVHVYDHRRNSWLTAKDGRFVRENTPYLTPHFAGIGSRATTPQDIQAIKDVFARTKQWSEAFNPADIYNDLNVPNQFRNKSLMTQYLKENAPKGNSFYYSKDVPIAKRMLTFKNEELHPDYPSAYKDEDGITSDNFDVDELRTNATRLGRRAEGKLRDFFKNVNVESLLKTLDQRQRDMAKNVGGNLGRRIEEIADSFWVQAGTNPSAEAIVQGTFESNTRRFIARFETKFFDIINAAPQADIDSLMLDLAQDSNRTETSRKVRRLLDQASNEITNAQVRDKSDKLMLRVPKMERARADELARQDPSTLHYRQNYVPHLWNIGHLMTDKGKAAFNRVMDDHLQQWYRDRKQQDQIATDWSQFKSYIYNQLTNIGIDTDVHLEMNDSIGTAFTHARQRLLNLPSDVLIQENLISTDAVPALRTYFKGAARAVEWDKLFGDWMEPKEQREFEGEQFKGFLKNNESRRKPVVKNLHWSSGAAHERIVDGLIQNGNPDMAINYMETINAHLGRVGENLSPRMRFANDAITFAANLMFLPLVIFASIPDIAMMASRHAPSNTSGKVDYATAPMKDTFIAMRDAFKELRNKGDMYQMARSAGIIADRGLQNALLDTGEVGVSAPVSKRHKQILRWNEKFFDWNLMNSWSRWTRLAATHLAVDSIQSNIDQLATDPNAQGRLDEIGVDVEAWNQWMQAGQPMHGPGYKSSIQSIDRFVDQAVVRPNAALRTGWMSDPRFRIPGYLKQFLFLFKKVYLDRFRNKLRADGRFTDPEILRAAGTLGMTMALAAMGLALRDAIYYAGSDKEPDRDFWDVFSRSGLMGPMSIVTDMMGHHGANEFDQLVNITLGPIAGKAVDFAGSPIDTTLSSIPLTSINYELKHMFKD